MRSIDCADTGLDKDQPLREDIRLLGRLLGDTLREQQGGEVFDLVEQIRQMAVRFRRNGQTGARAELQMILSGLSADATVVVARRSHVFHS
jgi:phosphoenolpyruvate carboxylase